MPSADSQPSARLILRFHALVRRREVYDFEVQRVLITASARWTKGFAEIGAEILFGGEVVTEIASGGEGVDCVRDAVRTEHGRALHQVKVQMWGRAVACVAEFREDLRTLDAIAEFDRERTLL